MKKHLPATAKRNHAALTLVEFLVVIVVIFIIIWVLSPSMVNPRGSALRAMDMSNLRQISVTYIAYAQDNENVCPMHPRDAVEYTGLEPNSMRGLYLNPYQDSGDVIERGEGDGIAVRYGGYVFVNLGLNLENVENPADVIIAYTAQVASKQTTRSVAFADGHVESWEKEQLRAALPEGVDIDALDGP